MLEVHSTKSFVNLPCAHAQWFDLEPDGSPGECASIHGYDRSVTLTFSGQVDEYGWIVAFGELKKVKEWLEYYFDHTTVLPANDKRVQDIPESMTQAGGLLGTLRVLPYGVSMEMSSLFILEHVNMYINSITQGRCYVSKVECREHERNSAFVTIDRKTADRMNEMNKHYYMSEGFDLLPMCPRWQFNSPVSLLELINREH
ncbi:hypothetical protein pf16_84 [Pseudomonas phage pf16]|uniref:Uncharacterized protein n=1 Tax=Pseudomonas phage pf16 TaxID=1815630 RepID=A0A1S5R3M4_9CAUD|nr:QueD-like 6-pyruvoyl-tetrahydropterin synthase [Pseudomonas phage pf16]AND75007.1 hypothetical protein pf16_84 [Pseudomonas phage pf16]